MSLLVLTPWDGNNEHLLERCISSVKTSGIEHRIIECGLDWELIMYSMRNDADYIAWVDADDIVYPGAAEEAFRTIEKYNVGLVYTDECRIDESDRRLKISTSGPKTMWDLVSHPTCVHKLTVTKKNTITDRVLTVHKETKCPLDWAMRVDAAINNGMSHVPIMGYGWRVHPTKQHLMLMH
jgi:hypothetical protein